MSGGPAGAGPERQHCLFVSHQKLVINHYLGGSNMTARNRTVWTFIITSAALFMGSLDNLVVTTALPSIRAHLHASLAGLQWTVNAYTLTFAVLLLTGAGLGQRDGRRRGFTPGLPPFPVGSAPAALAPRIGS